MNTWLKDIFYYVKVSWDAEPSNLFLVRQSLVKPVCLCLWGQHMNFSWCQETASMINCCTYGKWDYSGLFLEPHILNTWLVFPDPQRWLADNQVGGSGEKQTLPQALPLCTCLNCLQFTLGSGPILSFNLSAHSLGRFLAPLSHEDHWGRRCHGDVVRDDGGRRSEAAERFQPAGGKMDTHTHPRYFFRMLV